MPPSRNRRLDAVDGCQVRVRFGGQPELYAAVNALRALAGVTAIETRTVLREVLAR